ncbi:uncharacterized protein [Drosophila bipectinata]|uniref:uncharacterized protein n=1 Tax=Drosophila bipectinata TaxID=42026 RepID=UPI001C8A66B7|nr:uncharacterized protein LOC108121303 [Drosophila bipectinata]
MEDAAVVEETPQGVEGKTKLSDPAVQDQAMKSIVGEAIEAGSVASGAEDMIASFRLSTLDLIKSDTKTDMVQAKISRDKEEAEERKKILRELEARLKRQRESEQRSASVRLSQKEQSIAEEEYRRSTVQFAEDSPEGKTSPCGSENIKESTSTLTMVPSSIYMSSSRDSIDDTELDPMQVAVKSLMFVPHLSDLSLDDDKASIFSRRSRQKSTTLSIKSSKSGGGDVGGFKDPTSKPDSNSDVEANQQEEEESSASESSFDAAQFRATQDSILDTVTIKSLSTHDVHFDSHSQMELGLDDFLNLTQRSPSEVEVGIEPPNKDLENNLLVRGFVGQLINDVVYSVEHKDPRELLREKLDKLKLIASLEVLAEEFLMIRDLNRILNERMVNYSRQTKNLRNIQPLSNEETAIAQLRYSAALKALGQDLDRVAQVKAEAALAANKAIISLVHINNVATTTEVHLEAVIRKLLVRPDAETDFLKRMVAKELRLMAQVRNEISDTRLFLLTRLHTLAVTRERVAKLESVAENVSMNAFVATQANVVALEKKLEERNGELKKSRHQYHYELHQIQHNREKAMAIRGRLESLKIELVAKTEIRNMLKNKFVRLKMDRQKIRKEIQELTYRGGILAMPALMYDYDRTVEYAEKKEQQVLTLREKFRSGSTSVSAFSLRKSSRGL